MPQHSARWRGGTDRPRPVAAGWARGHDDTNVPRNGVAGWDGLPHLQYALGKLLYQSGDGELPRAIDYLARSTAKGADDPAEGYGLLAQAYLRLRPPDLDAALAANQKQIDHSDDEVVLAPAR